MPQVQKKRHGVDGAVVELVDFAVVDDVEGFRRVHRNHQVAGQPVPRPAGQYSQGSIGVDKPLANLVDGAVAADSHDDVVATVGSLSRNLRAVTGILGLLDGESELAPVDTLLDEGRNAGLAHRSGYGVKDECYVLHRFDLYHSESAKVRKSLRIKAKTRKNFMDFQYFRKNVAVYFKYFVTLQPN